MDVFISWSGDVSRELAKALHTWLPDVIQAIKPFMSEVDIASGQPWPEEIAKRLETTHFGVVCVAGGNQDSPWLNFEAGALSKMTSIARVCPLFFDCHPGEIPKHPLVRFQANACDEAGLRKLLADINSLLAEDAVDADRLERSFTQSWPGLAATFERIRTQAAASRADPAGPESETQRDRRLLNLIPEIHQELRGLTTLLRTTPPQERSSTQTSGDLSRDLPGVLNRNVADAARSALEYAEDAYAMGRTCSGLALANRALSLATETGNREIAAAANHLLEALHCRAAGEPADLIPGPPMRKREPSPPPPEGPDEAPS